MPRVILLAVLLMITGCGDCPIVLPVGYDGYGSQPHWGYGYGYRPHNGYGYGYGYSYGYRP